MFRRAPRSALLARETGAAADDSQPPALIRGQIKRERQRQRFAVFQMQRAGLPRVPAGANSGRRRLEIHRFQRAGRRPIPKEQRLVVAASGIKFGKRAGVGVLPQHAGGRRAADNMKKHKGDEHHTDSRRNGLPCSSGQIAPHCSTGSMPENGPRPNEIEMARAGHARAHAEVQIFVSRSVKSSKLASEVSNWMGIFA